MVIMGSTRGKRPRLRSTVLRGLLLSALLVGLNQGVRAGSRVGDSALVTGSTLQRAVLTGGSREERLELTFAEDHVPVHVLRYDPRQRKVTLEVRDVSPSAAPVLRSRRDALVTSVEVHTPRPRVVEYELHLAYPIPASHLQLNSLHGPARLLLEVDKDFEEHLVQPVTRNVVWQRREFRHQGKYALINELEIDPAASEVSLNLINGHDSLEATEKPTEMAQRKQVLGLINGGFFQFGGGGAGLLVQDGRILKPPVGYRPPRTALGFTRSRQVRIDRVDVRNHQLVPLDGGNWSDVTLALGGGPRLVRDGRVAVRADEEGLGKGGNSITHPCGRTAVALLKNQHVLWVTLSGFSDNHSEGWTLEALAQWLVERGAREAMGFDGGGSTAMVLDGLLVSRGWGNDKPERPVANAWALTDASPRLLPSEVVLRAEPPRVQQGQMAQIELEAEVLDGARRPVPDGTTVHFFAPTGLVSAVSTTHAGKARALWQGPIVPGELTLMAYTGLCWSQAQVHLQAGEPACIRAWMGGEGSALARFGTSGAETADVSTQAPAPLPTPQGERRGDAVAEESPSDKVKGSGTTRADKIYALVTDAWFNPLRDQQVQLCEEGSGQVLESARTDAQGMVCFSRVVPQRTAVRVRCSGLPAVSPSW